MAELLSFVKNSKWRLSAIFNYCVVTLDHPRSLYGDRKPVLKFHVDPFCNFEDIVNRTFCKFGLKRLSGPPKFTIFFFFGGGRLTLTLPFIIDTPKRHYLGGKHVLWAIVRRNRSSGIWPGRRAKNTQTKNKQRVEAKLWQPGCSPRPPLNPILTKFGMWDGLQDMFLKFELQDDRSINVGAVGVEMCYFPLTRLITYTTSCCYRTSRD